MASSRSEFVNTLQSRGYVHQCTELYGLDQLASSKTIVGYVGFDCTAPSLHVGNLLVIMLLRRLQQSGHKPILLMGGGTTKIGDPSDKDKSRPLLSEEKIAENMVGIEKAFGSLLRIGNGPTDGIIVNNADWLNELSYIPFLRDFGSNFTINRMLTFESVKRRISRKQPMTFLEFNYMLLQAYDFHELYKRFGCRLQMGGSDQWGNIVNGVELCRRINQIEVYGLTAPLLTTASGAKMGKTTEGAIWLDGGMLSAYDYWQYWRNTEDADVGRFLKLYTDLPLDEVAKLETLKGSELNDAKKILANETTTMIHGAEAAAQAAETARQTFEERTTAGGLPTVEVDRTELAKGVPIITLFRTARLGKTNSEIRRHIQGGGARINDVIVQDEKSIVSEDSVTTNGVIKLSIGKKRHALVKPV